MKIGILTFHCALNFGAILQAYALQEYFKSLGHKAYILDYRPSYLLKPYKAFKWKWDSRISIKYNVVLLIRDILTTPTRIRRKHKFKSFLHNKINLHAFSPKKSDIDAYVLGSDQIWNPAITNFDKIFFGHFPAAKNKKIFSYAASAGSLKLLKNFENDFLLLIKGLCAISVREKALADYIKQQNPDITITETIDPVLLAGRKLFESISLPSKKERPYLLAFHINYDDTVRIIAEKIARQKGLDLVELISASETLKNRKCLTAESPERFISLIKGASYVVTSSFHGTAFSILFEKDFNTISIADTLSERMTNLLSQTELDDRLVFYDNNNKFNTSPIDYTIVNKRITALRTHSQSFIHDVLS